MNLRKCVLIAGCMPAFLAGPAMANDLEGPIESVDASKRSFVVQGITFFTNETTDYDAGLRRFEDLKAGQNVEVDFVYREKRHIATEVELEPEKK